MSHERAGTQSLAFPWGQLLYSVFFVIVVVAGLYCGYWTYVKVKEFAAHAPFQNIPVYLRSAAQPTVQSSQPEQAAVVESQTPVVQSKPVAQIYPDIEDQEPVNILFMGIDQRVGENTTCRTDTMILISINPKDKSVSLLSIPRDLWVRIPHPKHESDKIATAHYWGEVENYPGGGPALAMKAVYNTIGVRPHYFVRLNFTGFERIIDTIGGIDIDVPETIDDDQYPNSSNGYEHLYIEAGRQHFDGVLALKYARTRYGSDDFQRMDRQRQIIMAVRNKVLSMGNLPQLIGQLPQLYRDMGDSLETDVPIDLMVTMAEWALEIKQENIHTASIDRRMTADAIRPDGNQVLIYNPAKARPIIAQLFRLPTPQVEATETSQVEKLTAEKARLVVYNGTPITGLAARVSSFLEQQGLNVGEPQNADSLTYEHTILTAYSDKPFTVEWLANIFGVSQENIVYRTSEKSDIDIAIIIGQDFPAEEYK